MKHKRVQFSLHLQEKKVKAVNWKEGLWKIFRVLGALIAGVAGVNMPPADAIKPLASANDLEVVVAPDSPHDELDPLSMDPDQTIPQRSAILLGSPEVMRAFSFGDIHEFFEENSEELKKIEEMRAAVDSEIRKRIEEIQKGVANPTAGVEFSFLDETILHGTEQGQTTEEIFNQVQGELLEKERNELVESMQKTLEKYRPEDDPSL